MTHNTLLVLVRSFGRRLIDSPKSPLQSLLRFREEALSFERVYTPSTDPAAACRGVLSGAGPRARMAVLAASDFPEAHFLHPDARILPDETSADLIPGLFRSAGAPPLLVVWLPSDPILRAALPNRAPAFASSAESSLGAETPEFRDTLEEKPGHQILEARKNARIAPSSSTTVRTRDSSSLKLADYFAGLREFDANWRRLVDGLDQPGTPQARIVFASLGGYLWGEHRLFGAPPCLYEPLVRVPFLVRGVRRAEGGRERPPAWDGLRELPFSLEHALPLCTDTPDFAAESTPHPVFLRADADTDEGARRIRGVVDDAWKLVVNLFSSDELYDLDEDPWELDNLIHAPACAARRDRLHRLLVERTRKREGRDAALDVQRRFWSSHEMEVALHGRPAPRIDVLQL